MARDRHARPREPFRRDCVVVLGDQQVEQVEHEQLAVLGQQVVGLREHRRRRVDEAGVGGQGEPSPVIATVNAPDDLATLSISIVSLVLPLF